MIRSCGSIKRVACRRVALRSHALLDTRTSLDRKRRTKQILFPRVEQINQSFYKIIISAEFTSSTSWEKSCACQN
ncbi:hypothetical protein FGO68_gene15867 [Halteria grandinella]|uniref:Uncharacterized protein n=1 Tax=Halteria grandinella TaxID=5974 RepID=A0A8J8P958_HALGN|nr:hypothetical protein FGO68_gene15867 [Halteria grandinella]